MTQDFDWSAVPEKLFADSVSIRAIDGLMHVAVGSGKSQHCFVVPLPAAKMIAKAMTKQVEEIERANNVVFNDRLPDEPMISPFSAQKAE